VTWLVLLGCFSSVNSLYKADEPHAGTYKRVRIAVRRDTKPGLQNTMASARQLYHDIHFDDADPIL
jgi:uncharacterized protein YceK